MGKVKIGVFGAGRGKTMIGQVLARADGQAELVAICDKYRPSLDAAGKMAARQAASTQTCGFAMR